MYYAYKDSGRTLDIIADSTIDSVTRYYCPNPSCDAHIYLISNNGLRSKYFRAKYKKYPHIDDCDYSKSGFNKSEFDESSFEVDSFFDNLLKLKKSSTGSKRSTSVSPSPTTTIKTVRQLYLLCHNSSIYDEYNGNKIADIIVDERTAHIYSKYVSGLRLVKGKFKQYDESSQTITIEYLPSNPKAKVTIKFTNAQLFKSSLKELLSRRDHLFIIAGEFTSNNCVIHSKAQLYPLPSPKLRVK